ncbi:hypothetical protein BV22DRAFT_545137 [Leucogyrophana mollusca]|uniref:Uncharacterized protein n=1 Tax=Leucogyrophana mollusca TaxID=85980 RepID=A0ACB8BHK3_9AGAM|nr:hypothetical protein BV22DRAFT_545137 [Leucogyrophana mollusca]
MPRKKKEEEEVYHVEVITQARINEDLEWEYYVKWGGYDSDANSWEPQENVQGCDRLLKSFWTHIGHDDKDYPIGYQVAAKDFWIQKEKKYFSETFAGEKLRRDESEKEAKRKTKEKQKSAKGKSVKQRKSVSDDSDASSDVPLSRMVGSLSQKRKKFVVDTRNPTVRP